MKKAIISFLLVITSIVLYSKTIPTLKKIVKELNSYQTYQSNCERTFSFPYGGTMTFEANVVTQKVPSDTLCGFYYNFEITKNTDAGETGDFSYYFNNQVFNSFKGKVRKTSLLETPEAFKDLKIGGGYRPAIQRSHQLFYLTPLMLAKEIEEAINNKNWIIVQNTDTIVSQEQCLRFSMESNKIAENPLNSNGEINEVHTYIEMYFNKSKLYPVYYAKKIKTSSYSTFNTTYFRNTKINPVLPQNYFSEENLIHQIPLGGVKPAEKEMLNPSSLIGQKAPEWELPVLGKDEILSNTDLLGKYILLEFTATWCSSCIPAVGMMNRIENKFENVKNVAIVSIFSSKVDTKDGILKFVEKNKMRSAILYSATEVEKKYHISSYPNFLIVSPKGKVLIYYQGYNETVEKNILSMLSEYVDLKDSTIKEGIDSTECKVTIAPVPSISVKPDISGDEHNPLYILDGVIVDKTQFKAVKPEDIKSVSILRNKSETDKYGEKAKNGVILMVTKKNDSEASKNIDGQKFLNFDNHTGPVCPMRKRNPL